MIKFDILIEEKDGKLSLVILPDCASEVTTAEVEAYNAIDEGLQAAIAQIQGTGHDSMLIAGGEAAREWIKKRRREE